MPTVLNLVVGDPGADPRARRVASAAEAIGWHVVSVGLGPRSRSARRAPYPTSRALRELRGLVRLARLLRTTIRLTLRAREASAEVVHAHDLESLPAGWITARRLGARLVYDAHELYTGMDVDPPRLWLRLIWRLEGALAGRAHAVVTVSEQIAAELVRRHDLASTPLVVLNCPPLENVAVEAQNGVVRAIYQAAVGPGRDLTELASAAERANGVELAARVLGAGTLPSGIARLEPVRPHELVRSLAGFDVGLVIDRPETDNARLALPNKVFEYLMAGLAIVTPRVPAMAALVERERVGTTYEAGRLGEALAEIASDRPRLAEMRTRARRAAVERYNAEAQRPMLYAAWGL
jgi:glycogen(starch) synthase